MISAKLHTKGNDLLLNSTSNFIPNPKETKKINVSKLKSVDSFLQSSPVKSSNLLNLSELIDFSKQAISEVKKHLNADVINHKDALKELKRLVIERLFWNKKGKFEARLNQISESSSAPSYLNHSFKFNFSLNLSITYQDIKIMEGQINYSHFSVEINLEFTHELEEGWLDVTGSELKLIDKSTIDTGRYHLKFLNRTDFLIYDKITSLYTRIWGDPHVDLSDVDGDFNGEFSDLRESFFKTKFVLLDGTNVIFNAPDAGVIESVFVIKGNSKAFGLGTYQNLKEQLKWSPLEKDKIDIVYAGGDGNDWFTKDGRLIWGG